ncbi:hypothetical protein AAF712_009132 [Marasmius tenuissimus]|uniref:Uncharacterized protein n=1 Tax=Marasmius tenuissimus TaxID=585030 RepID=A0ABR2ZUE0_9AGAR
MKATVGDPYRHREEWEGDAYDALNADADGGTNEEEEDELGENGDGEEGEEPRWEAEEDFTLEHVFNSPDDDDDDEEDEDDVNPRMKPIAIVYYHTNSTKIHITLNNTPFNRVKDKEIRLRSSKPGTCCPDPVNITANTPIASSDGSLAEDKFEEEDLTAGLVKSNWDGDALEEYLSHVGVGAGVKNPMCGL